MVVNAAQLASYSQAKQIVLSTGRHIHLSILHYQAEQIVIVLSIYNMQIVFRVTS